MCESFVFFSGCFFFLLSGKFANVKILTQFELKLTFFLNKIVVERSAVLLKPFNLILHWRRFQHHAHKSGTLIRHTHQIHASGKRIRHTHQANASGTRIGHTNQTYAGVLKLIFLLQLLGVTITIAHERFSLN